VLIRIEPEAAPLASAGLEAAIAMLGAALVRPLHRRRGITLSLACPEG
jgi:hypothetical protein